MKLVSVSALVLALLPACFNTFDYSVYSARVPASYHDTRQNNFAKLEEIRSSLEDSAGFRIALISDSHTDYNDLEEAIQKINQDQRAGMILFGGDMTDGGLLAEFMLFNTILQQADIPYFTTIGNHDCLANGLTIYKDMYGPVNYSFEAGGCKFIFFNDVIWELNFEEPDYFWLREQLADAGNYNHVFVIAHIPPFSDSFTPLQEEAYTAMMDTNQVSLSIHGHQHNYDLNEYYKDGIEYLVIGSISKRYYVNLDVRPDTLIIEKVNF